MEKSVAKKRKQFHAPLLLMFNYKPKDELQVIQILIDDMSPCKASQMAPGLPADILFLCLRYAIHMKDEEKAKSFLSKTVAAIQRVIEQRPKDAYVQALWLANACQIVNNYKIYSDILVDPKSSIYRYIKELEKTAISIYRSIFTNMNEQVAAIIKENFLNEEWFTTDLNSMLNEFLQWKNVLISNNVHSELISKIFKQVFYFLCAETLNFTMSCAEKHIRLDDDRLRIFLDRVLVWCENKVGGDVAEKLQPLVQAANLLQRAKLGLNDTDDDVTAICEEFNKLSFGQILTLLTSEKSVSKSFIEKVRKLRRELNVRRFCPWMQGDDVYMKKDFDDTELALVQTPLYPYRGHLEEIEIPNLLHELRSILQFFYIPQFTLHNVIELDKYLACNIK